MIRENRVALAQITVATVALFLGTFAGLMQVYERAGASNVSAVLDYYRLLTAHGVLLAIVFTTFFICGLCLYATYDTIPREGRKVGLAWTGFTIMVIGTAMAAFEILAGNASVLYTFYAPLKASPFFYLGTTLLVAGTWFVAAEILINVAYFRRTHKGSPVPLPAFMSAATFIMWSLATIPVAVEMLILIPWAFGLIPAIDAHFTRMLFWAFGHPLVYFWILGAYIIWYTVIPKILDVPMFSDSLARLAFVLFIVLSLPVGLHHQFLDPASRPAGSCCTPS